MVKSYLFQSQHLKIFDRFVICLGINKYLCTIIFTMDPNADSISHPGIIEGIDKKTIRVKILSQSACASCNMKGACNMSEMQEKIVEVDNNYPPKYKDGDQVSLIMEKSMGAKAVLLAYVLPFLVVLIALIVLTSVLESEGLAGITSLALVAPYYVILYLQRDKLKKTFHFRIE